MSDEGKGVGDCPAYLFPFLLCLEAGAVGGAGEDDGSATRGREACAELCEAAHVDARARERVCLPSAFPAIN